jgi:hypothetical protein
LLSEAISDWLRDIGIEPVGPVGRLQEACYLARERALDGALLDIKLRTELCFPAASKRPNTSKKLSREGHLRP